MTESPLRAMWFALFTVIALVLGGFGVGYGVALLTTEPPVPAHAVLPPLVVTPEESGTVPANDTRSAFSVGAPEVAEARSASQEGGGPPATPPPTEGVPQRTQPGAARLAVSLDNLDVNTEAGGVEVVLQLHNDSTQDVSFSFSPASDLSLVDGTGHRYELRWAEFDGTVKVPARDSVRLVKAFFGGLPEQDARHLTVSVGHPPQLSGSSWQVSVAR